MELEMQPITGDQLRAARAFLMWTQDELAAKIGVTEQTVRAWEACIGMPIAAHADRVRKLHDVLASAAVRWTFDGARIYVSLPVPKPQRPPQRALKADDVRKPRGRPRGSVNKTPRKKATKRAAKKAG